MGEGCTVGIIMGAVVAEGGVVGSGICISGLMTVAAVEGSCGNVGAEALSAGLATRQINAPPPTHKPMTMIITATMTQGHGKERFGAGSANGWGNVGGGEKLRGVNRLCNISAAF